MSSTRGTSDPQRDARDFYRTPEWCVRELYRTHPGLPHPTLDPCGGDGALMRACPVPNQIRGVELDPELVRAANAPASRTVPLRLNQGDGLALGWRGEHVLMNPPYRDALEWVVKGVEEADSVLALLRLGFMGSQARMPFWVANTPRAVVTLAKRPSFTGKGSDSADYAWFFWTKSPKLQTRFTTLSWICDSQVVDP